MKVASCQFGVGGDVRANCVQICEFMRKAKDEDADIVHFPECALSGYAGTDFETFDGYDWQLLRQETQKVMTLAAELKIRVLLGSSHRLTEPNKPHNSLYLISPDGRIVDRYDKRFGTPIDLDNYTSGNRFVNFDLKGIKCSLLICFDLRFPEIYRELYKQGVQCIFQSFYNARQQGPSVHSDIMRQTMQCRAATNYFWISMTNSSAWYSPYPSCFIRPDGKIVRELALNTEGMMVNTVDVDKSFYDPMADFRNIAINGGLSNGSGDIDDPRSRDTENI